MILGDNRKMNDEWLFYKLYGEIIKDMGDEKWKNYVRHRKISKGES